ncbi:hypothetical protein BPUTSESOX_2238 [uncultured Gammaproteobacteria bacterium]|nr:hypothetical protein [uncultured Gammaproteobacteria bacterium]CAC9584696.1 hypothetical protein [uncultured Gammaproteobacteria bacterium]CAC9989063.1 hypothetical protein [uncultured Gammaproteobacteria bacterium]VVH51243.1 hypothetical protein BPUTSESOX_2238 [uncultured Gammaproteobacteria bacterium]
MFILAICIRKAVAKDFKSIDVTLNAIIKHKTKSRAWLSTQGFALKK